MSSMKQADKKRSPTDTQTKRPSRVDARETKLQQEKSIKTLRSNEAKTKMPAARVNSNTVISNSSKNIKANLVHEKLVTDNVSRYKQNKSATDLDKETNDERDESDSETVTDSLSSSGDSRANEDEKVETPSYIPKNLNGLKVHPKQPSTPSSISSIGFDSQDFGELKEMIVVDEASNGIQSDYETVIADENAKNEANEALNLKIAQMEMRIEKLEDELREVAALEISLYSVVQEHASSGHKVHTPAHLSKLYIHAGKHLSQEKHAMISKNIVSGLIMVSTSCGNDVSRLTFWWSNIVVLREIITQTCGSKLTNNPDLTSELEKIESQIFSRITESIWLQTLMPNMVKNKTMGKLVGPTLGDQQQSNFSITLWQNAFQDAFKRLCPVRAGGHECGCLPLLAKMVMEQCIARLDVAMFNAILRESANDIPTDNVSDPITELSILPISNGDLSFGSGAQLQKAVGNWSKWLSDRFTVDTNGDHTVDEDNIRTSKVKWFHHLDSFSHLLMVPKDMLTDRSIRAEVCPSISLPLLKRILSNFTPDEFCPDPVPNTVLEAIDEEYMSKSRLSEDSSRSFPYAADIVGYRPPSSISKQYTSHEELANGNITSYVGATARFQLLHEVWSS